MIPYFLKKILAGDINSLNLLVSFDDKFLDEIIHVQSLKALSMHDYLPANVLKHRTLK